MKTYVDCVCQFRALSPLKRAFSAFGCIWLFRLQQTELLKTTSRKKSSLVCCSSLARPLINHPFLLKHLKSGLPNLSFIIMYFLLTGSNKWMRPRKRKINNLPPGHPVSGKALHVNF